MSSYTRERITTARNHACSYDRAGLSDPPDLPDKTHHSTTPAQLTFVSICYHAPPQSLASAELVPPSTQCMWIPYSISSEQDGDGSIHLNFILKSPWPHVADALYRSHLPSFSGSHREAGEKLKKKKEKEIRTCNSFTDTLTHCIREKGGGGSISSSSPSLPLSSVENGLFARNGTPQISALSGIFPSFQNPR